MTCIHQSLGVDQRDDAAFSVQFRAIENSLDESMNL
jgi:hypothetical protein